MQSQNWNNFPCCATLRTETDPEFPSLIAIEILGDFQKEFRERFSYLDRRVEEIPMFQGLFTCDVNALPAQFQSEVIYLQSNDILREKYKKGNLLQFYKSLDSDQLASLQTECSQVCVSFWNNKPLPADIFKNEVYKIKIRSY